MTSASPVEFTIRGRIATLRIARPEKGNAVDLATIEGFEAAIERLDGEAGREVVCVVLTTARGKAFCAGGDLEYFATIQSKDDGLRMSRRVTAILDRLWRGPQVVVGAVHGAAIGGGCEIVTACHLVVADNDATFQFVQAARGVTTGWGGGLRLLANLGRSRALALLLSADPIDAPRAVDIGLATHLVEHGNCERIATELAEHIAAYSPEALRAFLRLAAPESLADFDAAREQESEAFADLSVSPHFREQRDRFLRKTRTERDESSG